MLIKSLDLQNIRSYTSQTITFEEGTTILSGDIGSGKTTILIALEYALFGLLRGKIQPHELLRHSAKEGSISLHLEINGHDVRVTRGLKRGKSSIAQTPGVILVDGVEETFVATELKARVLQLLGYPESLLSKSTNLFRYTVYTPQEHVKQILHETVEERKDIVRKIFGIDKYKHVVENTTPYVSDLRERIARRKGQTDDVNVLVEQLTAVKKELTLLSESKQPLELSYEKAKGATLKEKEVLDKARTILEEQKKELHQQQLATQKIESEKKLIVVYTDNINQLTKRLEHVKLEENKFEKEKKEKAEKLLVQLAEKKSLLDKKYGELNAKETQSKDLQNKILDLETCPTCQQDVTDNHKKHISHMQEELLKSVSLKRKEYDELGEKITEKERAIKVRLQELVEEEKKHYLFVQQQKQFELDTKRLTELNDQLIAKQKTISELELQTKDLKKIELLDISKEEGTYETVRRNEQQLALQVQKIQTQEEGIKRQIMQLEKTIVEKEKIAKEIMMMTTIRNWVKELFVPLVKTIEKRVLLNIYAEFNTHFKEWFTMLIDDESLLVRLDEDFTPLIEQHGFDTTIANLSGGEKTSLALAYRLALNKVLNDYFSSLHTKGLLILDEPTDGFSSQQLDKLRDVLDQIGVKQVIIVSHEQKLESLADHLIHVVKDHQISKVHTSASF